VLKNFFCEVERACGGEEKMGEMGKMGKMRELGEIM